MASTLADIQAIAEAGDQNRAQAMLKELLKQHPTADAWVLAAQWTQHPERKIQCLRQALRLDEWHTQANRLLHQLEGATPRSVPETKREWDNQIGVKDFKQIDRSKSRDPQGSYKERQRFWTQLIYTFLFIFMIFTSGAIMRAVGFLSMGGLNTLFGDPPITELDGIPLAQVEDAIYRISPNLQKASSSQGMEIVDAGYVHQHDFMGVRGEQYAIFIQFLSFTATNVSRNVVIISEDGRNIMMACERTSILANAGDTGVAYTCTLPASGRYAVRVLGREGESVGAYFVGVERLRF